MSENNILGVVLAGGKSKRFGEDKSKIKLEGKTLIEHTLDKIKFKFNRIIIISNNKISNDYLVINDCIDGNLGPLVGVLTAMKWIKENNHLYNWITTFPCDTPFFPESIIKNFIKEAEKKESLILSASSHGRKHNIFGLWSLTLYDKLENDLINKKIRKVQEWTEKNKIKNLEFKFEDYDPFFNINTKEDLEFAKKLGKKIKNE